MLTPARASVLCALLGLVSVACESGRPSSATLLADVVLTSIADPGFVDEVAATGPMPLDTAAKATTVRADVLGDYLGEQGYDGGFARVLTRGEEFVTLLAYDLADEAGAEGLVDLVLSELTGSLAFRPFDDPAVPGSRGFTLTSDVGGKVRFCVGEWFAHRSHAYAVTRCAPFVLSVPAVTSIALAQYRRVVEKDLA